MKCNQSRPGFELVSPCSFPTTITITPWAPSTECTACRLSSSAYELMDVFIYLTPFFSFISSINLENLGSSILFGCQEFHLSIPELIITLNSYPQTPRSLNIYSCLTAQCTFQFTSDQEVRVLTETQDQILDNLATFCLRVEPFVWTIIISWRRKSASSAFSWWKYS